MNTTDQQTVIGEADERLNDVRLPTYSELLSLLIECQPTLDHDASMARGTPAEKVRSNLAARVRAAAESAA